MFLFVNENNTQTLKNVAGVRVHLAPIVFIQQNSLI